MAAVRHRRPPLNLTLELPNSDLTLATAGNLFHLPPPHSSSISDHRLSDLEKLQVLGHGNGGTVHKVRHRRTGELYALKLLHPHDDSDPALRRQIHREIEILRRTDSPFVVRCHSILPSAGGDFSLLIEYMDAGTLDSLIRRHGSLPEKALPEIAHQILQGLSYVHSQTIVHRDIKPSNFLVSTAGEVKVSDFGVSEVMRPAHDTCHSYVGTCAYMSPERFDSVTYGCGGYDGYAGDVWGLGLTILELYLGHFPLLPQGQRPDWATLMYAICFSEPPSLPAPASEELRSFVDCCLQKDSTKRWTVDQLLSHPFVTRDRTESTRAFKALLHPID